MARSRESRTLEFEDENLPDLEARPRRSKTASREDPERRSRKRLVLAVVFLFFLTIFIAAVALIVQMDTFLATDPRFALQPFSKNGLVIADGPIELVGVEHVPAQEVFSIFEPDVGRSLYLLPLEARREQLLAVDWVEQAGIARLWPDRLQVVVKERVPVAVAAISTGRRGDAYQMMLLDRHGVLMRLPRQAKFDLPVVFGLTFNQTVDYRQARAELVSAVQSELKPLGVRFSEIDVSDPANLRISLSAEGRNLKLILGREKYLERVQTFLERFPDLMKANPQANLFDMRLENQIVASREGLNGG